jgi:hypothetical protein
MRYIVDFVETLELMANYDKERACLHHPARLPYLETSSKCSFLAHGVQKPSHEDLPLHRASDRLDSEAGPYWPVLAVVPVNSRDQAST